MKLINNYLDSFENYLPEESKAEIREELESSILGQVEDLESQHGRPIDQQEQEQLLLKIGHPMRVASAYLPHQELIGSDYFPAYKKTLDIALVTFGILTFLSFIPFSIADFSFIGGLIGLFFSLIETSVWVFTSVTLAFYLIQYYQVNLDEIYAWSPKQLQYSSKKISLSRLEIAFELVFESLFLVFWVSLFQGTLLLQDNFVAENLSLSDEWLSVYWLVSVVVAASILLNIYKLVSSGWSRIGLILNIILGFVDIAVILYILQFDHLVTTDLAQGGEVDWHLVRWTIELNIKIFLAIVAAVALWDIYSSSKKLRQL